MINSISIALTGLAAASKKINASASNIANLQTTGSLKEGEQAPYTPITVQSKANVDTQGNAQGVQTKFVPKQNPFVPVFDPDSPFADENGIIGIPNVNLAQEAININIAKIQFKANIATLLAAQKLSDELLSIFDKKI